MLELDSSLERILIKGTNRSFGIKNRTRDSMELELLYVILNISLRKMLII
jgi:hypothetical protein